MKRRLVWVLLFLAVLFPVAGCAHGGRAALVDVRIVGDRGGEFRQYGTRFRGGADGRYLYLEAVKGEKYSIQVANRSGGTVGVVIAVDGRNIISGKKSTLKGNERMYIIEPYATHTFEGWRTATDRTNRFYFTEQSDSYAERVFSDGSAMGTIALAVYREKPREEVPFSEKEERLLSSPKAGTAPPSPSMEGRSSGRHQEKGKDQAGTGFGESTYSPSRMVQFDREDRAWEKIVMKYEWRTDLCRKGIVPCNGKNRFWPDGDGFAPVPRDFKG